MTRRRRSEHAAFAIAALVGAGLLVAVAALEANGQLAGIDRFGFSHLVQRNGHRERTSPTVLDALLAYRLDEFRPLGLLRLPASVLPGFVLASVLCGILWRRGRRAMAVLWLGAFAAVNVVEAAGKLTITKPEILVEENGSLVAIGLLHSFPSGHAARATVLAALAAFIWWRLWPLFALWALLVVITAEIDGIHTLSDLTGGLLLAAIVILALLSVPPEWERNLDRRLTWSNDRLQSTPPKPLRADRPDPSRVRPR